MVPVKEMTPGFYAATRHGKCLLRRSIGKILLHKAAQGDIDCLLQEQGRLKLATANQTFQTLHRTVLNVECAPRTFWGIELPESLSA